MNVSKSENQKIQITHPNISLYIKREDLLHPIISGNKFRKLKYNLAQAKNEGKKGLLTFGGAFSNHILAVAAAGNEFGFKTVGLIRGDELQQKIRQNPTLKKAQEYGMVFEFVTRESYKDKNNSDFLEKLSKKYADFYIIPEGGTNALAVKGCAEILTKEDDKFDFICCAVGTGGTISGIINCSKNGQQVLGFPALKGDFLREDICRFATKANWELITDYHFGGYARVTEELIEFMNDFYQQNKIILDPIYTGKMVFGVIDLIHKGYFPENSKILMIHTGGLQGIDGMNKILKEKKQLQINVND